MATLKEESSTLLWIWLALINGAGGKLADTLFLHFGTDIASIYAATGAQYEKLPWISPSVRFKLENKDLTKAREILDWCEANHVAVLPIDDPHYPNRLRSIPAPPLVLYVRGTFPDVEHSFCAAIVGSRTMTEYGQHNTMLLSYDLAKAGAIIVSGMAKGIDGTAQSACIDAGGRTIAVLGCGVDRCYPPEHKDLMNEILQNGAVISEFPPFTPPIGRHFPIRNRIISGLCQVTIVTEASEASGALHTAHHAIMQGRDLFCLPGKVGEKNSAGTNDLLKKGAHFVISARDVLSPYARLYPKQLDLTKIPKLPTVPKKALAPLNAESKPRQAHSYDNFDFETLSYRTDASAAKETPRRVEPSVREMPKKSEETGKSEEKPRKFPFAKPKPARTEPIVEAPPAPKKPTVPLSAIEQRLYDRIPIEGGITADELTGASLSVNDVLAAITILEIKGLVQAIPGGLYIRA